MLPTLPDWSTGQWILAVAVAWMIISIFSALWWWWYLEHKDKRTPAERKYDQAEDDAEQAEYLREWQRKHGKPPFSEADKAFFRWLRSMTPDDTQGPRMLFIHHSDMARAYRVRPGGFVLVYGPYKTVHEYFHPRHWERLPFTFKERHIYRKPR